jgi:hypothetical protein
MASVIVGTTGDDSFTESTLVSLNDGDTIQGLAGNDTFILDRAHYVIIQPGAGNDTVDATASTGPVWVTYADSPAAITYEQGNQTVIDGWGGADTLKGPNLIIVGSDHADCFAFTTGFVYGGAGNDVIAMGGAFHGVDAGPGNDSITDTGTDNTLVYHDAPGQVSGSLAIGQIADGYGFVDTVAGASRLTLPAAGSDLQGGERDESFVVERGGHHRIDAGAGSDTVEYAAKRSELRFAYEGGWLVVTNISNDDTLELRNTESLELEDGTLDLTQQVNTAGVDYFTFTSLPMPSLAAEYATFSGSSVVAIDLNAVDLDGDGRPELVGQLYQMMSPIGLMTDAPTPNRLVILSQDPSGQYRVATTEFLANGVSPMLAGESRQTAVGDVNGDGFPDIAYSTSKEDGRDGNADNKAQATVLLSDATGHYHIATYGTPNWNHAVALAPSQGTMPGVVITAGFQGSPTVVTYGTAGTLTSTGPAEVQAGNLLYLPWMDDAASGSRYFYADVNVGIRGGGVPGLFKLSGGGQWTLVGQESDARYEPFGTVQFTTWQQTTSVVPTVTFEGNEMVFAGHVDSKVWHSSPTAQPLVVANLNVGQILDPGAPTVDQATGTRNANYLDFISFDPLEGPSFVDVTVRDEDVYYTGQFNQVADLNRDGYEDIVFYPYSAAGQPIVYLNDTRGGLYNAHLANFMPTAPSTWGGDSSSLLLDANGDGLLDLLMWPAANSLDPHGTTVALDGGYRLYLAQAGLGTGPGFANGADYGAPGFNEDFYLATYADAKAAVDSGVYASGLAHYLAVGQGRLTFATDVWVHGSAGADAVVLREGNERAEGLAGNDSFTGGSGNDTIDGGAGIDTARFAAQRMASTIVASEDGLQVTSALDGTDTLVQVERLVFADSAVAYDIDAGAAQGWGNAGMTARVLNTLLGEAGVTDKVVFGIVLDLVDRGVTETQLIAAGVVHPLFLQAAGATGTVATSEEFVRKVYANVAGVEPGPAELSAFAGLLDSGQFTQAQLAQLAADSVYNAIRLGLTGLAATGIDYIAVH